MNVVLTTIENTAKIQHTIVTQINSAAIQETASHLDANAPPQTSKIDSQKSLPDPARWKPSNARVIGEA